MNVSSTSHPDRAALAAAATPSTVETGAPGPGGVLLRNFSLSLASKLVSLVTQVAFVVVTTRLFAKEDVAVLAIAGITTMLMDVLRGLGLGTLLLKRLPQLGRGGDGEAGRLVRTYLVYSILPALAFTACGLVLPDGVRHTVFGAAAHRRTFELGVVLSLFTVLSNANILVLQASQQFGHLAALTMLTAGLPRLVPCLVAWWSGASIESFLYWSVGAAAVAFAGTCWPLRAYRQGAAGAGLLPRASFWPESRHFYYTSLLRYGATQIDQLLVAALFPPATLAVYYMLRRLYSIGVMVIGSMIDALVPELSQQAAADLKGARRRLAEWSRVSIFAGSTGAALLAGNGPALIALLLGPGYGDDPVLIALFAASTALYFLYCLVQVDLMLFHESDKILSMALATALANVTAGPAAAPWLGVHSIPLAMLAGYLVGLAAARWRHRRTPAAAVRPVWRIRELAIGLGVVAAASLLPGVVVQILPALGWERTLAINGLIAALAAAHCWQSRVGASLRRLTATAS